jgi:hypothetical protein
MAQPVGECLTPAELRKIGERLYGVRWQTKLARALPLSTRTIRSWLTSKRKIRPLVVERIRAMVAHNRTMRP